MRDPDHVTRHRPGATARARRLRRDQTDAESRLWYRLSGRELAGHKFVRQVPLGPYVVDFLCRSKKLVVELDGEQHVDSRHDEIRTRWLNRNGYSVLRFWNHEALNEREAVLDAILAVLEGETVGPSPGLRFAPACLSPAGRGGVPRRPAPESPLGPNMLRSREAPPPGAAPISLPSGERAASAAKPGEGPSLHSRPVMPGRARRTGGEADE